MSNATISLRERAEVAYDRLLSARTEMDTSSQEMRDAEMDVKLSNEAEYAGAKNNDVRAVLMARWLSEDEDYQNTRRRYLAARSEMRLAIIEVERIRTLTVIPDDYVRLGVES